MAGPLRRVLVRRPDEAFAGTDPVVWHYAGGPDLARARQEHEALVTLLQRAGAEVVYHDLPQPGRADAVFIRDTALITDAGAVILRPGKALRRGEEDAVARQCGTRAHPEMQWHSILGLNSAHDDQPEYRLPPHVQLPREETGLLVKILRKFTRTPETCWFAAWDGWGHREPLRPQGSANSRLTPAASRALAAPARHTALSS